MADTVQYGMVIDTKRCMGCQTCVISCKLSNQVPGTIYWNHVYSRDSETVYQPTGVFPDVKLAFRPELCNNCSEPRCVAECPTGAMYKREEDGVVTWDNDVCIGCGTCAKACPYGIPQVNEDAKKISKCSFCFERLAHDKLPWCVDACPAQARIVGDINDPESDVSKYITGKSAQPHHEEYGTKPSVYYV